MNKTIENSTNVDINCSAKDENTALNNKNNALNGDNTASFSENNNEISANNGAYNGVNKVDGSRSNGNDGVSQNKEQITEVNYAPRPEIFADNGFNTILYVVRHGESLGNAKREFLGHTDKDLSPLGYEQAKKTALLMAGERIDAVYSSDLIRAHNTAFPHAEMRGFDVIDSKELREIYAGEWEGMRVVDIIEKYPVDFYDCWRARFGVCRIPGGESVPELAERIHNALLKIARECEGKRVLIGCHAAAIRSFWGRISGIDPERLADELPFPANASVSTVYFDGEKLVPGFYSYDKHLTEE